MPKVLRIINRLNLGGITYNVTYLSRFLPAQYETMLVSGIKTDEEESSEFILDKYSLKPVYIKEMKREINFSSDRRAYSEIKDIIKKFKPDIVHTHAAKAGTLGRLAAASCKVPVIVHTFHGHIFHSYFNPVKTKIFLNIERYLARKSSAIVTISDIQKHEICDIYKVCSPDKAHVIPLGFDLNRFRENMEEKRKTFREKYNLDHSTIAIGIIGRFASVKNHAFFLQAFKQLTLSTTKKVVAFLIGDGEERPNILNESMNLNLSFSSDNADNANQVVLTSWIKDVDWALAGLDIIALTSFNEGTPVSLIEAQAAGKPIVSTRVGGIENVVRNNVTALLSDSGDLQAFTRNMITLCENDTKRSEMSIKGWDFVKEKFHYTRLVNDMDNLYQRLLAQAQ